jgi:hypothetical protein
MKKEFRVVFENSVFIPFEEGLLNGIINTNHLKYIALSNIRENKNVGSSRCDIVIENENFLKDLEINPEAQRMFSIPITFRRKQNNDSCSIEQAEENKLKYL